MADMSLRTAIVDRNDRLANKALYDLYRSEDSMTSVIILETIVFQALKTNPSLVQNAAALLAKSPEMFLFECTEFLDAWISRYDELSPDARHNLLHLYTRIAKELLNEWDVESQRLARVIHPDLLFDKVTGLHNQSLLLNFHLAAIEYYGQINASESIHRSFEYIKEHFSKTALSSEDRLKLALFFNNWSQYEMSTEFLLPHVDDADFSASEAMTLMGTAFVLRNNYTEEQLNHVMERAFELGPKHWCEYISANFQLRRDPFVKSKVCSYCGDK